MIDLHIHTKVSDGSMTIDEILEIAKDKGITHIAVTDHDTTKGVEYAVKAGERAGVTVIPGIEISAYDFKRNKRAHILGYFINPGCPSLESICTDLTERRCTASKVMAGKIIDAGYDITWEEIERYAGDSGVYKQHIMHALMDKGYCESIYSKLYKDLFKRGSSPETQGTAFIPLKYADAEEAIKAIRDSGGVAVLAHPGQLCNFDAVEDWVKLGLKGIEAYHQSHSSEETQKALQYAEKFGLVVTGGSDFHGFYGEFPVQLGIADISASDINELYKCS
ncbi:MAG TPA: PHP domain-containing protein, partial [Clostridia bacterium]